MSGFIAKQPNGLYCRFSYVTDCPTHWNMTEEAYLNNATGNVPTREEAQDVLDHHLQPFQRVLDEFLPNNFTEAEFDDLVNVMSNLIEG